MAWIGALISAAGAIGGGVLGAQGSKNASKAQQQAAQQQVELARQVYNSQLTGQEPFRATGLGANNVLAQLYGLPYYDYSPTPTINGMSAGLSTSGSSGNKASNFYDKMQQYNPLSPGKGLDAMSAALGLFGGGAPKPYTVNPDGTISVNGAKGGKKQMGGTIDPTTGTFTANNDPNGLAAAMNQYLQTGQWPGGVAPSSVSRFVEAANALRGSGWDYNTIGNAASSTPSGYHAGTGRGDLSVFQNSPGYQFRLGEGLRSVQNSAAARGGLGSGNSLRAVNDYAQGTASEDFYNFVNQMNTLSGRGQTATTNQGGFAGNYGSTAGNALGAYGDARASGVAGQTNAWLAGLGGAASALGNYWGNRNRINPSSDYTGWV